MRRDDGGTRYNFYEGCRVFCLLKSNFQVYKYNLDVLHILILWAFLLMPLTCATVSLKTALFIFIKISSSHLNLYAIFCVYLDTWEPGIVSHHCLACKAGENGKYRVQEFKDNVGGVLVLLQCTDLPLPLLLYSAHPKTGNTQTSHCVQTN